MAVAASGDQMNAIPTPVTVNGSTIRQIGVVGVISMDSHVNAIASTEKPNPIIGVGCAPVDDPADERRQHAGRDGHRRGQQRRTRRRQPAHRLGVEHHRQDHRRHDETDGRDADVGQAEVAVAEDAQRDERLVGVDVLPDTRTRP